MEWINDPQKWTENISSPSLLSSFRKELLTAGGTDAKGNPSFRVVWGQDFDNARVWSRYEEAWFPRYWYRTMRSQKHIDNPASVLTLVQLQEKRIGIPRFFIECRLDPDVFFASGNEAGVDSDGQVYREAVADPQGEWWTFLECCVHQEGCCAYANTLNSTCHGQFRLPNGQDLQAIRAYRAWLASMTGIDPRQPVTAGFKEKAFLELRDKERANREMLEREMELATKSFVNTHFHRLSDDPSVVKHGKYHFLKG